MDTEATRIITRTEEIELEQAIEKLETAKSFEEFIKE